jgi:hypothetical protein
LTISASAPSSRVTDSSGSSTRAREMKERSPDHEVDRVADDVRG